MKFIGIFNRDGGTFKTMDMDAFAATAVEVFAAGGHHLECRLVEGKDLIKGLEQAARDGEALLAGGGDGTISAAAGVAFARHIPLAVLPAGTMNLFARSLQIPLELDAALAALAGGTVRPVDIATANGRPFVHQFAVGLHSKLVKLRENLNYHGRLGKMLASVRAFAGVLARPPRFRADIVTRRGIERRAASGIFVTNNPFGEGHIPHADVVDGGTLGVYVAKAMNRWALAKLCVAMLRGTWQASPLVIEREVEELTLSFPHKKHSAQAVIDGELIKLTSRVQLKIHPGALLIVAPVTIDAGVEPEPAAA